MVLVFDIGNTEIVLGGFEGEELIFSSRISTRAALTQDEYAIKLNEALDLHGVDKSKITGAIISSVVPQINQAIKGAVRFNYGVEALVVGPGVKTGLGIRCDSPSSVGADLICACVAAQTKSGRPVLIIDIGTATKMMLVNEQGTFTGASIMPGVKMGLGALSSGTAQLPAIDLEAPEFVMGKNTVECMKSGIIIGHAAMLDGMIDRIFEEYGSAMPVVVTGGLSTVIAPHCKHEMVIDPQLVLTGINIIYNKNN